MKTRHIRRIRSSAISLTLSLVILLTALFSVMSLGTEAVYGASNSSTASHRVTTEKIFNMRDLGGYTTLSGRTVKTGILYRSGELAYATSSDLKLLKSLNISQVIDFRYKADKTYAPDKVPSGVTDTLVQVRKEPSSAASNAKSRYKKVSSYSKKTFMARVAGSQKPVKESYTRGLIFDSYSQKQYKKYFDMLLANTDGKPILFHCIAGKDRTGVAAVMTLLVLGVDEETAINEYAATNEFYKSVGSSKYGASSGVTTDHIRKAIKDIKVKYGSLDAFFEKAYGLTASKREQLRDIYLTSADEPRRRSTRIAGSDRYNTSIKVADALKAEMSASSADGSSNAKFGAIVLASGKTYPDALAGSALAIRNDAPLLLISDETSDKIINYIRKNLAITDESGNAGKIYVLGGTAAVSNGILETLETDGYDVERLSGETRYETNLEVLDKIWRDGEELFVCTGTDYSGSLTASATGAPILLVNPNEGLTDDQKEFLSSHNISSICIAGGTASISEEVGHNLMQYGNVTRFSGSNRYDTSVKTAQYYSADLNSGNVVIVYGNNFPDGLCAGPLAYAKGASILLTNNSNTKIAASFCKSAKIQNGIVIGGKSLISNEAVKKIIRCDEVY